MNKPSGVLVIALFYVVLSVFSLLAGTEILTGTGPMASGGPIVGWFSHPGRRGASPETIAALKSATGIFFLALGVFEIALAVGLVKLKEWARSLTVVLTTIIFMRGVVGLLALFALRASLGAIAIRLCLVVIEIVSIGYLIKPNIRAAFQNVGVQAKSA